MAKKRHFTDESFSTFVKQIKAYINTIASKLSTDKVDKDQGVENAGKILAIDETGIVVPNTAPEAVDIVYHEDAKILEFVTKSQLPGNVGVDPTLTISGDAADSKVVGDKFAELEERIGSGDGSDLEIGTDEDALKLLEELEIIGKTNEDSIQVLTDGDNLLTNNDGKVYTI